MKIRTEPSAETKRRQRSPHVGGVEARPAACEGRARHRARTREKDISACDIFSRFSQKTQSSKRPRDRAPVHRRRAGELLAEMKERGERDAGGWDLGVSNHNPPAGSNGSRWGCWRQLQL